MESILCLSYVPATVLRLYLTLLGRLAWTHWDVQKTTAVLREAEHCGSVWLGLKPQQNGVQGWHEDFIRKQFCVILILSGSGLKFVRGQDGVGPRR